MTLGEYRWKFEFVVSQILGPRELCNYYFLTTSEIVEPYERSPPKWVTLYLDLIRRVCVLEILFGYPFFFFIVDPYRLPFPIHIQSLWMSSTCELAGDIPRGVVMTKCLIFVRKIVILLNMITRKSTVLLCKCWNWILLVFRVPSVDLFSFGSYSNLLIHDPNNSLRIQYRVSRGTGVHQLNWSPHLLAGIHKASFTYSFSSIWWISRRDDFF